MNSLGVALLLIFILHLIDKHNRWRQALKLTVGMVVLGILGVSGFLGWQKYEAYRIDLAGERMVFLSVSRAAAILLCLLTEVQAYFRFEGANINKRLHDVWKALNVAFEIKELYQKRYRKLMEGERHLTFAEPFSAPYVSCSSYLEAESVPRTSCLWSAVSGLSRRCQLSLDLAR